MSRFKFSNFQPCSIYDQNGALYPSVEHFYQAAKSLDPSEQEWVRTAPTPAEAKKRGRQIALRADWPKVKDVAMRFALRQKFAPGTDYAKLLVEHTWQIVEYNFWHDNYWGVCQCPRHYSGGIGIGLNKLGIMLMEIRSDLLSSEGM